MRADNSSSIVAAAQQRAAAARERAQRALEEFHREGRPISVAELARAAGVSRSWIYTQPDVLQQLQGHNQTARKPRRGPAERASDASLHRRLELAHQRIRQLAADNQRLRDQLARAYGALRAVNTGHGPTVRGTE
jgi:hypothetical protein